MDPQHHGASAFAGRTPLNSARLIFNARCAEWRCLRARQSSFMLYGFFDRLNGLLKAGKQI